MLGVREANFQILDGDFVGTIADGDVALVFKQDAAIGLDFFDEADAKVKAIVVLKRHQTCFALRGGVAMVIVEPLEVKRVTLSVQSMFLRS